MKSYRLFIYGIVAVLALLIISACSSSRPAGPAEQQPPGSASEKESLEPYRIGVIAPLTGPASWVAEGQINGIKLFVNELNAAGGIKGHKIDLLIEDDQGKPDLAVIAARKFIDDPAVLAIVGSSLQGATKAISPLVKETGPVVYSLSGGYEPENKWTWGPYVNTANVQKVALDWIKSKGMKRIALLASNDATGQTAIDSIKPQVEERGIELVIERMNPDDVDVTPQLNRIRSAQAEAVLAWVTGKPMTVIVKNFAQMGFDIPLIVSHGNANYPFAENIKAFQPKLVLIPATKDLVGNDLPDDDPQKPRILEFHSKYQAKYGKPADVMGGIGWDIMGIIAQAIEHAGPDRAKIRDYMENLKGYVGVQAVYNFSPEDHRGTSAKDAVMVQVVDGTFRLYRD